MIQMMNLLQRGQKSNQRHQKALIKVMIHLPRRRRKMNPSKCKIRQIQTWMK